MCDNTQTLSAAIPMVNLDTIVFFGVPRLQAL